MTIPRLSRKRLLSLEIGESRVFTESTGRKKANAGASSTCYASRAGIKMTTRNCYLIFPDVDPKIEKILLVTRLT